MLVGTRRALLGRKLRPAFSASFLSETPISTHAITYSGGANATRVNAAGLIVPAVCPRSDFDPVTLAVRGLLVEEQRTNLMRFSADLASNTPLTQSGATLTPNFAVAPDGTNTAARLQINAGGFYYMRAIAGVSGAHTGSIYVRRNTGTGAPGLRTNDGGGGDSVAISPTLGWQRFAVTRTFTGATAEFGIDTRALASGDGAAVDLIVWGAQFEPGAFHSSYIPTAGSAVTRTADVAIASGIARLLTGAASARGYTLLAEYSVPVLPSSDGGLLAEIRSLADGSTTGRRIALFDRSGFAQRARAQVFPQGVSLLDSILGTSPSVNTPIRVALASGPSGNSAAVTGGFSAGNATPYPGFSGNMPDQIGIGSTDNSIYGSLGTTQLNGHVRRLDYWDAPYPLAALQALTA